VVEGVHPFATTDDISVAGYDPTTVALSWSQSGDLCFDSYQIQEATYSSGGPWTTIDTISTASVTAIYDYDFGPGMVVWFQDIDNSGCGGGSATSNVVEVTFPNFASLSYSDTGSSTVQLSWDNNADYGGLLSFDYYQITEDINGGGFSTLGTLTTQSADTYSVTGVTGLNTGTVYKFQVLTTDDCNDCSGGSYPQTTDSNTVTHLTIDQPTSSTASLEVGQSIQFADTVSGGNGPYSFVWIDLPEGCSSADSNPLTCTPTVAGTSSVTVTVTDARGITLTSLPVSVAVVPGLTVGAPTASSSSIGVGGSLMLTAAASLGVTPYTYSWSGLPTGCTPANASTIACSPTTAGTFEVTVRVTDAYGVSKVSPPVTVSVTSGSSGGPLGSASPISTDAWLLILVVVVVLVAVVVVLLSRRGGKPGPSSGSQNAAPPAQWSPPPPEGGPPGTT
jgi:hypothetical protein